LSIANCPDKEKAELQTAHKQDVRDLAKLLVGKTNLASIVAFAPSDFYFTGLFNLFSQPEFEDYKMVLSMSQVVDSLEKAINSIYHNIDKPQVLLGEDNPFSVDCSVVIAPLPAKEKQLLAVLGPTRMDYNKILGLFDAIIK
jgi:transcriptional regulator of heat shock response